MKKTGVYIIVLITHGDYDIVRLSEALEKYQMFSYPYYYIATDGWLDDRVIHKITANETSKLQKYEGIIGYVYIMLLRVNVFNMLNNTQNITLATIAVE